MLIRHCVLVCAVAHVSVGCAWVIGIEDLPEPIDAGTPDASMPEPFTCMPAAEMTSCHSPGYPMFAHEGSYPEDTPCPLPFEVHERHRVIYRGGEIELTHFYHPDCGSYARIENAPTTCVAVLERSTDLGASWDWVAEIVEPELTFAYTQIGNDLEGRKTRAVLACDGQVLKRTAWH
jgi:hypothetical protein